MYRRFFVLFFRRSIFIILLICLGCSAQSAPADLNQRIQNQVRAYYKVPESVNITVGPLKPSDFTNYDTVTVVLDNGTKKQDYEFLLSKDHKTLARLNRFDLTKDPYADVMQKIDVSGRPVRGNKSAKVEVVNFDDFECPYCSHMHQVLFPGLLKEYGDQVKFIYKDFPLSDIHPWAIHAAVDANCLAAQSNDAYWDFADYIHANQAEVNGEKGLPAQFAALDHITLLQGQNHHLDQAKLQVCVKAQNDAAVKASVQEGDALGIDATPTMFVNGAEIDGALPVEQVRATIDGALRRAGLTPPPHTGETSTSSQVVNQERNK